MIPVALVAAAGCAGVARAQSAAGARGAFDGLERVEPGVSDMGPLGVEIRHPIHDMRMPLDFEALYRGVGANGTPWFARRDGGITAVFPRSWYVPTQYGEVSIIPPDTIFYIGDPPGLLASRLGLGPPVRGVSHDRSGGLRLDSRIDLRFGSADGPSEPPAPDVAATGARVGVRRLLELAGRREREALGSP
jgi:hypothetical protein